MVLKGHTQTKKRNPDGNEDSFQILHNLNEGMFFNFFISYTLLLLSWSRPYAIYNYLDELGGFEENWKVNADKHIPGWNDGFSSLENAGILDYEVQGHMFFKILFITIAICCVNRAWGLWSLRMERWRRLGQVDASLDWYVGNWWCNGAGWWTPFWFINH